MERLTELELKPFQVCINAGADIVMTSHIHFPVLESKAHTPATLSYSVMTELLRNQLGFLQQVIQVSLSQSVESVDMLCLTKVKMKQRRKWLVNS